MTPSSKSLKPASCRMLLETWITRKPNELRFMFLYVAERKEIAPSRFFNASSSRAWRNLLIGESAAKRPEIGCDPASSVRFTARRKEFRDATHHCRLITCLVR